MKKSSIIGIIGGIAAGAAATVAGVFAVKKVSSEIKASLNDCVFTSPDGDNVVTVTYGSSDTAMGLTCIKVKAALVSGKDCCKLMILTRKREELYSGEWIDNNRFKLLVGNGKRKQCCDIHFDEESITANYYVAKE